MHSQEPYGRRVSIHAPWEGCDLQRLRLVLMLLMFQFTHPGKGATEVFLYLHIVQTGFNSRTLGRVRLLVPSRVKTLITFQFTHPGKGATAAVFKGCARVIVSIHAPWEGCDFSVLSTRIRRIRVSIHAPWEGCDAHYGVDVPRGRGVSIHAPWEGCDTITIKAAVGELKFQFTHPGKGATSRAGGWC